MSILELASCVFLAAGGAFFLAGTVGLLRFPDVYTRLHALTKADNLGLGFIVVGLTLDAQSALGAAKLWIAWALVMVSSSVSCQLVARSAKASGVEPWRKT